MNFGCASLICRANQLNRLSAARMAMRYAIYFTPPKDETLTRVAERWLGRSAFGGGRDLPATSVGRFSSSEIAFHTAAPRRYGFHATLKTPFRLAEGRTE